MFGSGSVMSDRNLDGTFAEGNTASVGGAMGGENGIKLLGAGEPLRGMAAQSQREVEAELEADGRAAIVKRAAVRLEAVARLFFDAILAAADKGDVADLARYAQRFAWLQTRALQAWAQVKQEQKDADNGASAKDVLDAIRGKADEQR
jgi:hypothetical protein